MRRKLGMSRLGEGPAGNVRAELAIQGGATGFIMGAVNGMMYHPGASN